MRSEFKVMQILPLQRLRIDRMAEMWMQEIRLCYSLPDVN